MRNKDIESTTVFMSTVLKIIYYIFVIWIKCVRKLVQQNLEWISLKIMKNINLTRVVMVSHDGVVDIRSKRKREI